MRFDSRNGAAMSACIKSDMRKMDWIIVFQANIAA